MASKNKIQNSNNTSINTRKYTSLNLTNKSSINAADKNADHSSQSTNGYISGDSTRSSSSHQFQRNSNE